MAGLKKLAASLGSVVVGWAVLLALEHVVVTVVYREYFSGAWELWPARVIAAPLTLGALAVLAPAVVGLRGLVTREAVRGLVSLGAVCGAAIGYGTSFGRHFSSWAIRGPFIVLVAGAGAICLAWLWPRLSRSTAVLVALACAAWALDAWVLPRLYPAFHWALFAATLAASGTAGLARVPARFSLVALPVILVCAVAGCLRAQGLVGYGNMTTIMADHAPILGRGLRIASLLTRQVDERGAPAPLMGEIPRALDWTGHDIVLISIDALRADHVGAYGYPRPTTPHVDALAAEGVVFDDAYCPTPHTSYSVTSMMTGKYMRPLISLGLGEDSETWAAQLRRYEYQTAAFYPPAVFYIDPDRFGRFERTGLDFEYRKEEFAEPDLRDRQVSEFLQAADTERPLFLWVHFFEPHEPYVQHPEHRFGDSDLDAYDSEIAATDDGVGKIVSRIQRLRKGAVIILTADHGEEFGEHGSRYHGTTVYEEQVHVPLIVLGPGVPKASHVHVPVQTIDLLPTTLSALGIPRPARIRGRDLGPLLAHPDKVSEAEHGLAFAETDDFELYAKDADRLVCDKRTGGCALYDVTSDRSEVHDTASSRPDTARAMRAELFRLAHDHGKYEGQGGTELPEALRLGMQGDVGAAPEVAALLDDANVDIRRKAAKVLFSLHGKGVVHELDRALARDEDLEVQSYVALALVRAGEIPSLRAEAVLRSSDFDKRKLAALAFADRGDKRASGDLAAWWSRIASGNDSADFVTEKEIVVALGKLAVDVAEPDLVHALRGKGGNELRLRPYIADSLGQIGDPKAKLGLFDALKDETQASSREHEARALAALGAKRDLASALSPLVAGPSSMLAAVTVLREAGALAPDTGGWSASTPQADVKVVLTTVDGGDGRILVLVEQPTPGPVTIAGSEVRPKASGSGVSLFEVESHLRRVEVASHEPMQAVWAVRAKSLAPDAGMH